MSSFGTVGVVSYSVLHQIRLDYIGMDWIGQDRQVGRQGERGRDTQRHRQTDEYIVRGIRENENVKGKKNRQACVLNSKHFFKKMCSFVLAYAHIISFLHRNCSHHSCCRSQRIHLLVTPNPSTSLTVYPHKTT